MRRKAGRCRDIKLYIVLLASLRGKTIQVQTGRLRQFSLGLNFCVAMHRKIFTAGSIEGIAIYLLYIWTGQAGCSSVWQKIDPGFWFHPCQGLPTPSPHPGQAYYVCGCRSSPKDLVWLMMVRQTTCKNLGRLVPGLIRSFLSQSSKDLNLVLRSSGLISLLLCG